MTKSMNDFPKPIKVKIFYEEELKKITKKNSEEAVVSEGLKFVQFLSFVFTSYPEIQKNYPPGKLGLLLNDRRPQDSDTLKDGDEVTLKYVAEL